MTIYKRITVFSVMIFTLLFPSVIPHTHSLKHSNSSHPLQTMLHHLKNSKQIFRTINCNPNNGPPPLKIQGQTQTQD